MDTYNPTDKLAVRALGREAADPGKVFGARARTRAENTELRKLLRYHRGKLFTKFVDRSRLDKLLVQSGLIAQSALMRAAYSISGTGGRALDRIAEYNMAGRALCQDTLGDQFWRELLVSTHFCVLLEKAPLKKAASHAALFGNYLRVTRADAVSHFHNDFPYDALNFDVHPDVARQTPTPRAGAELASGGIFRNLQTVAPTRTFKWNQMRVRGLCGFTGTFAPLHIAAKSHGLSPGHPLLINIFCVSKGASFAHNYRRSQSWGWLAPGEKLGGKRQIFTISN